VAEVEQQQAPEPAAPPPPRSRSEIAKEVFGDAYVGEVGKAEPEETAPPPDDTKEGAEPVEEPAEGEPVGEPEEATAAGHDRNTHRVCVGVAGASWEG
jgi:hypothetical protein